MRDTSIKPRHEVAQQNLKHDVKIRPGERLRNYSMELKFRSKACPTYLHSVDCFGKTIMPPSHHPLEQVPASNDMGKHKRGILNESIRCSDRAQRLITSSYY